MLSLLLTLFQECLIISLLQLFFVTHISRCHSTTWMSGAPQLHGEEHPSQQLTSSLLSLKAKLFCWTNQLMYLQWSSLMVKFVSHVLFVSTTIEYIGPIIGFHSFHYRNTFILVCLTLEYIGPIIGFHSFHYRNTFILVCLTIGYIGPIIGFHSFHYRNTFILVCLTIGYIGAKCRIYPLPL